MTGINGREYQHALIQLSALSDLASPLSFGTFKKLSYKVSNDKKPVMNSQGQIIGYTIDNQKIDASVSMLLSEWRQSVRPWLLQVGGAQSKVGQVDTGLGVGQVAVDFSVFYGNSPFNYMQDRLSGVMFNSDPVDSQDNQESLVVEIPLFVMAVTFDDGNQFVNYRQ